MISEKSKEIQNTQVQFKNTASNTLPIVCASCGSVDYLQTFSPFKCLKTFSPELLNTSGLKQPDICGDEFSFHSRPPLLPPIFNSYPTPAEVICETCNVCPKPTNLSIFENNLKGRNDGDNVGKPNNDFSLNETRKFHQTLNGFFTSPDKISPKNFISSTAARHNNINNIANSEPNYHTQTRTCSDNFHWACRPLIVPVIPYYVLCNSKCSDNEPLPRCNFFDKNEKVLETNKKNSVDEKTPDSFSSKTTCEETNLNHENQKETEYQNTQDIRETEECLNTNTESQWMSSDKDKSSSSLMSLNSLSCCEESFFFNPSKENDITISVNNSKNSHIEKIILTEQNTETSSKTTTGTENMINGNITPKTDIRTKEKTDLHPSLSPPLSFEDDLENNSLIKDNDQNFLLPETTLKAKEHDHIDPEFQLPQEKIIEKTQEEEEEANLDSIKNAQTLKKEIRVNVLDAAGGDLGSGNSSYRVLLTPSNERQDIYISEETSVKGQKPNEPKVRKKATDMKDSENLTKSRFSQNFKSGTPKVSNSFKIIDLKPEDLENKETGNKISKQVIQASKKNKNNYISTEKILSDNNERFIKSEKIRKHQVMDNQASGSEKLITEPKQYTKKTNSPKGMKKESKLHSVHLKIQL